MTVGFLSDSLFAGAIIIAEILSVVMIARCHDNQERSHSHMYDFIIAVTHHAEQIQHDLSRENWGFARYVVMGGYCLRYFRISFLVPLASLFGTPVFLLQARITCLL